MEMKSSFIRVSLQCIWWLHCCWNGNGACVCKCMCKYVCAQYVLSSFQAQTQRSDLTGSSEGSGACSHSRKLQNIWLHDIIFYSFSTASSSPYQHKMAWSFASGKACFVVRDGWTSLPVAAADGSLAYGQLSHRDMETALDTSTDMHITESKPRKPTTCHLELIGLAWHTGLA